VERGVIKNNVVVFSNPCSFLQGNAVAFFSINKSNVEEVEYSDPSKIYLRNKTPAVQLPWVCGVRRSFSTAAHSRGVRVNLSCHESTDGPVYFQKK